MFQGEGVSSASNITEYDDIIQSTYLSHIVNLVSPIVQALKNYRRNNRPVRNTQNPSVAESQSRLDLLKINNLKKEIGKIRITNTKLFDKLAIEEKVIENICSQVLTPLENLKRKLDKNSKVNEVKINTRKMVIEVLNNAIRDLEYNQVWMESDEIEDLKIDITMLNISYGMLVNFTIFNDRMLSSILKEVNRFTVSDIPMLEEAKREMEPAILNGFLKYENILFDDLIKNIQKEKNDLAYNKRRDEELIKKEREKLEKYTEEIKDRD